MCSAVVEGCGVALVLGDRRECRFELAMNVSRRLVADFLETHESRLAADQREHSTGPRCSQHQVPFEVTQTSPLLSHPRKIAERFSRAFRGGGAPSELGPVAATVFFSDSSVVLTARSNGKSYSRRRVPWAAWETTFSAVD